MPPETVTVSVTVSEAVSEAVAETEAEAVARPVVMAMQWAPLPAQGIIFFDPVMISQSQCQQAHWARREGGKDEKVPLSPD
jgi:hypothetical protein